MGRIRAGFVAIFWVLLLFAAVFCGVLNVPLTSGQPETIYIRADGSVEPDTAPISSVDNVTYTFTGNIYDSIVVERDDIVVDGANYTVQGTGSGIGIEMDYRSNVTLKNAKVTNFRCGIWLNSSSNNVLSGNIAYSNDVYGISVGRSNNNLLSGNNVTDNYMGITLNPFSNNNVLSGNNAAKNSEGIFIQHSSSNTVVDTIALSNLGGIVVQDSSNNTITGNTIISNSKGISVNSSQNTTITSNTFSSDNVGTYLGGYCNNTILFHNNFINNTHQTDYETSLYGTIKWDNGYPSGGNYWSDYTGVDANGDGIGDTPYTVHPWGNQDNYPLMSSWPPPEHDLITSIEAPSSIILGGASSLNATATNRGSSNETNVEILLLVNGTTIDSTTIPLLQAVDSYTLSYLWTPAAEGTYNVTAYAHPSVGETSTENNQKTKFVTVSTAPTSTEVQVGVRTGDWIKIDYTISGWPAGTPHPEWLKVEFLSVEGTTASVRVTMHMSDGTEQSETVPVDVAAGGQAFGLSGLVIPANSKVGDSISFGGFGITASIATVEGETTKAYAGASRTVVYASFSQLGTQLTYYWDKQTGVMVEASTTSGSITGTGKATETNMWQADSSPFWMQWWFYVAVAVVIVALGGAVYFLKKRKPPTPAAPQARASI